MFFIFFSQPKRLNPIPRKKGALEIRSLVCSTYVRGCNPSLGETRHYVYSCYVCSIISMADKDVCAMIQIIDDAATMLQGCYVCSIISMADKDVRAMIQIVDNAATMLQGCYVCIIISMADKDVCAMIQIVDDAAMYAVSFPQSATLRCMQYNFHGRRRCMCYDSDNRQCCDVCGIVPTISNATMYVV